MKKLPGILILLLLITAVIPNVFAQQTVGASLTYSPNMEFSQRIIEEVNYTNGNFSFHAVEHSGQKLLVGTTYDIPINKLLSHRLLADFSLTYGQTYGTSGWTGLGYMIDLLLAKGAVYIDLALGAQLALAYSPYFATTLFSATPLCEAIAGLKLSGFEALAYMSFCIPSCKEWKAIPSVGAKAFVKIADSQTEYSHWLGAETFIKFAEYLTDPRTMVSAFGVRILYEYRYESRINGTTKEATNENL